MRGALGKALVVLFIAGVLTGCKTTPPPMDMSLLTHEPCAPPCWQYIIPGVSDEEDVRIQLENSPFVKEGTLHWGSSLWEGGMSVTSFAWESAAGRWNRRLGQENRVVLHNGVVLWIEIGLEYKLTLGQVVEKYGAPRGLLFSYGFEDVKKWVLLYYPNWGISFWSLGPRLSDQEFEQRVIRISEDLEVVEVTYFSAEGGRYLIERQQMPLVEWHGFGEYKWWWVP